MEGIVVFSFGFPNDIVANRILCDIASGHSKRHGGPILSQREVSIPGASYTDIDGPQPPITTLGVARKAVQWAKDSNVDVLCVVAMPPHIWRCVRDLEYAIKECGFDLKVRVSECARAVPESKWFMGDSEQWYTKRRIAWRLRDRILKLVPMWLYIMIAS